MPHLEEAYVLEKGCKHCYYFQKESSWCMRYSCVELQIAAMKEEEVKRKEYIRQQRAQSQKKNKLSPKEDLRRMELYRQGYSDNEMAKLLGLGSNTSVATWRRTRKLPVNKSKVRRGVKVDREARLAVYRDTPNDRAAAAALGITNSAFRKWRESNGLPCKSKPQTEQ